MWLVLVLASLPVKGDSLCPTAGAVTAELSRLRPQTSPLSASVEVLRSGHTVEVGLYDAAGELHAARSLLIHQQSCAELAEQVAQVVHRWEQLPEPTPKPRRPLKVTAPVLLEELRPRPRPRLPRVEQVDDAENGRGFRVLGGLLGTGLAAVMPSMFAWALGAGSWAGGLLMLSTTVAPPLLALGALVGHHAAGGRGHYGFAVLGALLGCGSAMAVMFLPRGLEEPADLTRIVPAAVLAAGVPVLFLELSDARERDELRVSAGPLRDGAVVSVSGSL